MIRFESDKTEIFLLGYLSWVPRDRDLIIKEDLSWTLNKVIKKKSKKKQSINNTVYHRYSALKLYVFFMYN